jgi:uncharacterized protein YkwD
MFCGKVLGKIGRVLRWPLLFTLGAVFFLSLASCTGAIDSEEPLSIAEIEARIFTLVNDHRLSIGRSPLAWSAVMADEERAHSQAMANGQIPIGHDGFHDRADRVYLLIPWYAVAENVAFAGTPENAMQAWLNSPEHQVLLEGDYDMTGVGVAKDTFSPFYYFSQMFLKLR